MMASTVICDHRRRFLPRPGTDATAFLPRLFPKAREDPTTPRFYQTKPFVMLAKSQLKYVKATGYADYRKMTNGFVFGGIRCGDEGNGRDGARPSMVTVDSRAGGRYEGGSVSGREFTL